MLNTELPQQVTLCLGTGGRVDLRTGAPGHLQRGQADPAAMGVGRVADAAWVAAAAETVAAVRLSDEIVDYVLNLVRATRETADLQTGASPNAVNSERLYGGGGDGYTDYPALR